MKAQIYHGNEGWIKSIIDLPEDYNLEEYQLDSGFSIRWETEENKTSHTGRPLDKNDLKLFIAQRRWEEESKGIIVNGIKIETDRPSQAMITGAITLGSLNPNITLKWKTTAGFVSIDLDTLKFIAGSVGQHVQNCFGRESDLLDELETLQTSLDLVNFYRKADRFWA